MEDVVKRHLDLPFQKPIPEYTYEILDQIKNKLAQTSGQLILDSGCGTGSSTIKLAEQFPEDLVIGIDQSIVRLGKKKIEKDNVLFFRANLIDIWMLMEKQDWRIDQHFLFYPNPWPKKKHLQRRWHGHPIFPALIKISKKIEVRTNWKIYTDEFSKAIEIATTLKRPVEEFLSEDPITPFEKKYFISGQTLYVYQISF